MGSLQVLIERSNGKELVRLAGSIDEAVDLEKIFERLGDDVVLNLRDVERINSVGVHRWIPSMATLTRRSRVCVEEISYPVVMQANCVANLFAGVVLKSCMAPYFCPTCNDSRTEPVTRAELAGAANGIPARSCSQCGTVMEFDELDGYFSFMML